jgi:hypothetical protein
VRRSAALSHIRLRFVLQPSTPSYASRSIRCVQFLEAAGKKDHDSQNVFLFLQENAAQSLAFLAFAG